MQSVYLGELGELLIRRAVRVSRMFLSEAFFGIALTDGHSHSNGAHRWSGATGLMRPEALSTRVAVEVLKAEHARIPFGHRWLGRFDLVGLLGFTLV